MNVKITIVQPDTVDDVWDKAYMLLKPAIDEDLFMDERALKKALKECKNALFVADVSGELKGAAVIGIEEEKNRVAHIFAIGGRNLPEWEQQLNAKITEFAKSAGCRYITALGRKAWSKIWPEFSDSGRIYYFKEVI